MFSLLLLSSFQSLPTSSLYFPWWNNLHCDKHCKGGYFLFSFSVALSLVDTLYILIILEVIPVDPDFLSPLSTTLKFLSSSNVPCAVTSAFCLLLGYITMPRGWLFLLTSFSGFANSLHCNLQWLVKNRQNTVSSFAEFCFFLQWQHCWIVYKYRGHSFLQKQDIFSVCCLQIQALLCKNHIPWVYSSCSFYLIWNLYTPLKPHKKIEGHLAAMSHHQWNLWSLITLALFPQVLHFQH